MCGKIRADADRRIIQNCPYGRGVTAPIHLFGSGFAGLGCTFTKPQMRVQRKRTLWVQAVSARSSSRQRSSRTSKFCSQAVASQFVRD